MPALTPHHHLTRHKNSAVSKRQKSFVDHLIWIAAIAGIVFSLPQIYVIWVHKQAAGVSPITWGGYAVLSLVWLTYGSFHKSKIIVFSNTAYFIINALVALGALLYR